MSREHVTVPVWTWVCDQCKTTSGDLGYQQSHLPGVDAMHERGWYIAPLWGDLCPKCNEQTRQQEDA